MSLLSSVWGDGVVADAVLVVVVVNIVLALVLVVLLLLTDLPNSLEIVEIIWFCSCCCYKMCTVMFQRLSLPCLLKLSTTADTAGRPHLSGTRNYCFHCDLFNECYC